MAQSSPKLVAPATSKKANDAGHGNRFQSKLLMLYAMRAINLDYQFYLGTELDEMGGKFDDLIFKYKNQNDATTGRYHYFQAKHKLNENAEKEKIKEDHLIYHGKDTGIFDLRKYFQSYVEIKSRGDDIEHCIICTNVDFDYRDLNKNGIKLLGVEKSNWPKILDCSDDKPEQAFYKFVVNNKLHNHMGKAPLVWDFFDKLIFSVKMPNEDELDSILAKEVGKHFQLSNNMVPSAYIMNEMVNWFKKTDKKHYWLTAEKAKEILSGKAGELMALNNTTAISIDYQNQLSKNLEFNYESIVKLVQVLKSFWDNPQVKILHISSKTPKLTAVKVISAIQKLSDFPNKDDYLVISSRRIKEDEEQLKLTLKVKTCHHLLVVVDETKPLQVIDQHYENLIHKGNGKKKIILISNQNFNKDGSIKDSISVGDLSEKSKEFVGKRKVSFQGSDKTVSDLIDLRTTNEVLDSTLIENLLADDAKIQIPSFTCSKFQESLYIKRKVAFPSTDELIKELLSRKMNCSIEKLMGKCKVDSNGRIHWHVQDKKRKEELWKNMKAILKENDMSNYSSVATLPEEKLIDPINKNRVVIMGVAGTGKSTILSHYYNEIKKTNSDCWVIKISLVVHKRALIKIDFKEALASDFFINATGIDQNPFAQLLLKHRLKTGNQIVIMLDGFDEINSQCQDKVVQFVKNLNESIPLYITTRPHMADELQFQLSQLAYSIVKFKEEDQINFVISIWKDYLKKERVDYEEEKISSFATELIGKVSNTLNDKEKEFIGIPLQCRICAECFQSTLLAVKSLDDLSQFLEGKEFDLANLYKMMFEEKRRVFREEKIKFTSGDNHIVNNSIEYFIRKSEVHLRKLAIQTIVEEQNVVDILIPSTSFESEEERKEKEEKLNESGICLGFLDKNDRNNTIQFLHRTYAEYLVADYIYKGFLLDDERHNKLLEKKSIRKWIVEEMLEDEYNYNGVRVFFDSMLKEVINHVEWRNIIKQRNLPDRLEKFARLLCDQTPDENWALFVAFKGRNSNLSLFIFDCLDVQLTPEDIRPVMIRDIQVVDYLFHQRTDVFQRMFNYFNDADDEQLKEILEELCSNVNNGVSFWRESTALELKQENVKRNVEHFFDFMMNSRHREKVKKFLFDDEFMPICLIHHEDDELTKKYFTLVSSVYSDDFDLTRFMKEIIVEYQKEKEDWQIDRTEKALVILRDLGRINVAAELSLFVLLLNSGVLQQDENVNFRSSLEEMGMTGLHGMAFRGDLKSIEKHIGCSLDNPETYSGDVKSSRLIMKANKKDMISVFEVAAAYGHEEICRKILKFLQGMNNDESRNKLLIDGIKYYKNVVMTWTISKSVKAVWGQNALIDLLKPMFYRVCSTTSYNSTTSEKQIFEIMFCVVAEDKGNGYRDANELIFQDRDSIKKLELVPCDILQGMIMAAGGLDNWIKRLMNTDDIERAFSVLRSDGFLDKLDQIHKIPKLIDIIITLRPSKEGTMSSYWLDCLKYSYPDEFIKNVAKRCGEDDLKRLLFARDGNNIVVVFRFRIRRGRDWLETKLPNLPTNLKKEIEDLLKEETPQLIDHFFSSSTFLATLDDEEERFNAIECYLENGNEMQLSKFSQVVDVRQLEEALRSVAKYRWRGGERCKEFTKLLKKKLDDTTKVIYNSLIEKYSKKFNEKKVDDGFSTRL